MDAVVFEDGERSGDHEVSQVDHLVCVPLSYLFVFLSVDTWGDGMESHVEVLPLKDTVIGILEVIEGLGAVEGVFLDYGWKGGWDDAALVTWWSLYIFLVFFLRAFGLNMMTTGVSFTLRFFSLRIKGCVLAFRILPLFFHN